MRVYLLRRCIGIRINVAQYFYRRVTSVIPERERLVPVLRVDYPGIGDASGNA